jgi:hypothetical protein
MKKLSDLFLLLFLLLLVKTTVQAYTPTTTSFTPTSGALGTLFAITGTNLSSPTAFKIGGVTASAFVAYNTGSTYAKWTFNSSLGNYSNISIATAGGNATISPDAAPTGGVSVTAYSTADFKGLFTVNQNTGAVTITNAHPAGTYQVTVNAGFGINQTFTQTFTLTVGNTLCSQGQFYAPATPEVAVGSSPQSVVIGDFNGDGKQDIATANYSSNSVSIRLGDGQGGFSGTTNVAIGSNPFSVAIDDFNGDGWQDIATANYSSNSVSIRFGDGQGGFSGTTNVAVGSQPYSLTVGDFNGDGWQDIATANRLSNSVSIRLGDGLGGFSGTTEIAVGSSPQSVVVGDFNGDGYQDIAVANSNSNTVSIRLGDGLGGFNGTTEIAVGSFPYSVAIGDFNDDGKQDIAVTNEFSSSVSIRLGDGLGGFSGTSQIVVGSQPRSVVIGDFNGDGKQDIATANFNSNSVSIRLGDGQGGFSGITEIAVGSGSRSVAVGDFNGDGNQDIATVNRDSETVSIRLGVGDAAEINLTGNGVTIPNGNTSIATADHTDFGNGLNTNRTYTIQNSGTGPLPINSIGISGADMALFTISGITLPTIIATGSDVNFSVNFSPTSLGTKTATVTINNDDCDEGAYTFNVQATASIAPTLGNYSDPSIATAGGNAMISPDAAPTGGVSVTAYATTDFKGLLTVDQSTGVVTITNAHPAGSYDVTVDAGFGITKTFTLTVGNTLCSKGQFYAPATPEVAVGIDPYSVAVGDFNGDGHQDIATANIGFQNTVYIRLGDGQGGFSGTTNVAVGTNPRSVAIGDFNGDGNQDIAAANSGSNSVSIRLGDGQGGFSGTTDVAVGSQPYSVTVGDFNGDGWQDIATANFNSSSVSIRLGDGQGGFSGTTDVAVGSSPQSVVVGDFNGDGHQDIAVANSNSNTVSIRLGDGLGGFSGTTEIAVGSFPYSVAIGDFNDDGKQDIATANIGSNSVSIRLGDGLGGFSGTTNVAVGSSPISVVVGDFNGDGKQDIAAANYSPGSVAIRLGDGLGGFSGTTNVGVGSGPVSLAVGDFDGDGKQDIAVANYNSSSVSIRLGVEDAAELNLTGNGVTIPNGNTSIATADYTDFGNGLNSNRTYTIQNAGTGPLTINSIGISGVDMALFTISGITLPTIIAAESEVNFSVNFFSTSLGTKTATVTINNDKCDEGAYTFNVQATSIAPTLGNYSNPSIATAGGNATISPDAAPTVGVSVTTYTTTDFKGLLTVDQSTGVVSITNAHPAGTYAVTVDAGFGITQTFTLTVGNTLCSQGQFYAPETPAVAVGSQPYSVAVGDFNGDGHQDIATANLSSNSVSIRLGDGLGGFSGTTNIAVGSSPYSVAVGDFNGDGKQDIATANFGSNSVSIRLGDGQGGFSGTTNVVVGSRPVSLAIGDFNGDGNQDIATANRLGNSVSIRLGDGEGGFSGSTNVAVGSEPFSVAIGDFNGDGHQDIATANFGSGTVSIRLGDGQGGFSGTTNVAVASSPYSIAVGDFNGDGKQDIATANGGSNSVSIRLGDGLGGFSGTTNVAVGSQPYSVAVGDFNGDGHQDIATANIGSNSVSIRLGDGQGGFSGTTNVAVGSTPTSVVVGDFNGDGHQDIAAANYNSGSVSIRLGDGQGGFSGTSEIVVGSNPQSLAVGDFDGDGKHDIAAANYNSSSVSIRLGVEDAAELNLTGNGVTIPNGNTGIATADYTDFGNGLNTNRTYAIQNAGTAPLTINSIGISGADMALFTISGITLPTTIAAESEVNFSVNFFSTSLGTKTATVTINNDKCDEGSYAFNVQAESIAPTLGNYFGPSIATAGGNATISPDAAPTGGVSVTINTTTDFKGLLTVDQSTGVVSITNAHPAGSYEVTVDAGFGITQTFTLTVGNTLCSQGQFYAPAIPEVAVGSGQYSVAVGDFNGDGIQDIVATNSSFQNIVSIRLGDGQGGFSGTTNVAVGSNPKSVAVGDFNGDGNQDIAVAIDGFISIRLGDGQGGFSGTTNVAAVGTNLESVAVGDFNGDGHQDIAVANSNNSSSVSIRLGDGQGGFSGTTNVAVGILPRSVVIGDFNGDGHQDIATANFNSNSVSIRLGDGLGGFTGTTNVAVGTNPRSVVIGDFNGDGHQDIAVANFNSNSVSIRLGDGLGGFSGTSQIVVGSQPRSVVIGDFNGDGNQDIATANEGSNSVSIRLGDGLGGFIGTTNVTVGENPQLLAVGDFNGDGNQDIAVANNGFNSSSVSIRLGIGDAAEINLTGNGVTIPNGNTSITTADHTDFGNGYNINRTYTIQNAGTGPLPINSIGISGADMALFTISGITLPITIAAGSEVNFNVNFISTSVGTKTATVTINNDDCDEGVYTFNVEATSLAIILGNYSDPSIAIAGGNATVSPDAAAIGGASMTAYTSTDFRGLLTVDQSTGVVTITNAHPAGTYAVTVDAGFGITKTFTLTVGNTLCSQGQFYALAIPEVVVGSNPFSVAVGDFNGDGIQDIATANSISNSVSIRLGDGQGGFSSGANVAVGSSPQSLAIGDFNGDGKQDIATANRLGNSVSIRLGDGQGGFSGTTEVGVGFGTRPVSVVIGDFNGDGKQDIATANQFSSTVSIRLGDGQGGFSGTTNVAVGSTPRSVAIGDFNGDGHQDIATANFNSNSVSIRLGDGQGGFSGTTNVAVGLNPQSLAVGDFNGDGHQDIATANFNSNSVSIRLGDGQGGFSGTTDVAVGSTPRSVAIGDFNGDGNQDIATANEGSNSVSIRLGDGQGGFSGTTEITVGIAPRSVAVGDFNGDGNQDIAAANNNTAGSVSILLGVDAEINLQGNGIAITSGDNTPDVADDTDFGTVVLNTPSTKTYTVQNTGTSDLIVSAIDISGTDSASFAIGDITLPATIAAGDDATFTVTLTAGTSGVKSATVTISNDDCDESAYTFSVQGGSVVNPTGVISGDATVCAGLSTQLSIALTGQGPWSGTLSDGTVFSGSDNPLLVTVNPSATTTYSIATLSSETATASASDLSGSATVTVTALVTYYADVDGDGFGNDAITLQACSQPLGYAAVGGDCNDNDATIYPGVAEICYDGIDQNCDGMLTDGCPQVLVRLRSDNCGATLTSINQTLRGDALSPGSPSVPAGVSRNGYRFRVTNLTTSDVREVTTSNYVFNLGFTDIAQYNTTYSIEVAVRLNQEWMPYGQACLVTTPGLPTTQLTTTGSLASCGSTVASMNSIIRAGVVTGALAYEYEVRLIEDNVAVATQTLERPGASFNLLQFQGILPLKFGAEYEVRGRVLVPTSAGNEWSEYGAFCSVFTPLASESFIEGCSAETGLSPATLNTVIYSRPSGVISLYRYRLVNEALSYDVIFESTSRAFRLSNFNAISTLTAGAVYSATVEYQLYGFFYDGKDCNILVPGGAKMVNINEQSPALVDIFDGFKALASPNPFSEGFNINVYTNSTQPVGVAIYDVTGRLLETKEVTVDNLNNQIFGERYPSGVYNLVVTQDEEMQTVRVIKK